MDEASGALFPMGEVEANKGASPIASGEKPAARLQMESNVSPVAPLGALTPASVLPQKKKKKKKTQQASLNSFFGVPRRNNSTSSTARVIAPSIGAPIFSQDASQSGTTCTTVTPLAASVALATTPSTAVTSSVKFSPNDSESDTLMKNTEKSEKVIVSAEVAAKLVQMKVQKKNGAENSKVPDEESTGQEAVNVTVSVGIAAKLAKLKALKAVESTVASNESMSTSKPSISAVSAKIATLKAQRAAKRKAATLLENPSNDLAKDSASKRQRAKENAKKASSTIVTEASPLVIADASSSTNKVDMDSGEDLMEIKMPPQNTFVESSPVAENNVAESSSLAPKRKVQPHLALDLSAASNPPSSKRTKRVKKSLSVVEDGDIPALKRMIAGAGATGVDGLCNSFVATHPKVAKNQLKKKIAELAVKEKREGDSRAVWYLRDSEAPNAAIISVSSENKAKEVPTTQKPKPKPIPLDPRVKKLELPRDPDMEATNSIDIEPNVINVAERGSGELVGLPCFEELLNAARAENSASHGDIAANDPNAGELKFVALLLQGSHETLPVVAERCCKLLARDGASSEALGNRIRLLAERTCYGVREKHSVSSVDTNTEALWRWEVANVELLPAEVVQAVQHSRKARRQLSVQINAVVRLVAMLRALSKGGKANGEGPQAKVNIQEEKVLSYARAEEARRLKLELKAKAKAERDAAAAAKKEAVEKERAIKKALAAAKAEAKAKLKAEAKTKAKTKNAPPKNNLFSMFGFTKTSVSPVKTKSSSLTSSNSASASSRNSIAESSTNGSSSSSNATSSEKDSNSCALELERALAKGPEAYPIDCLRESLLTRLNSHPRRKRRFAATYKASRAAARAKQASSPMEVEFVSCNGPSSAAPPTLAVAGFGVESDAAADARLAEIHAASFARKKLLQFDEDERPAYFGTFRTTSSIICPRNPFRPDHAVRNYEVDSEAEWEEEPEDAEGVDSCDDDDEGDENDRELDYKDGWLMEDDVVEYEPEEDGADPSVKKVNGLSLTKKSGNAGGRVVIVGVMFSAEDAEIVEEGAMDGNGASTNAEKAARQAKGIYSAGKYTVQSFGSPSHIIPIMPPTVEDIHAQIEGYENAREKSEAMAKAKAKSDAALAKAQARALAKEAKAAKKDAALAAGDTMGGGTKRTITDEQLPRFLSLLEGSTYGRDRVIMDWLAKEAAEKPGETVPSKAQLKIKINEVAEKTKGKNGNDKMRWRVKPDILTAHGLMPYVVPPTNADKTVLATSSSTATGRATSASPAARAKATKVANCQNGAILAFVKRSPNKESEFQPDSLAASVKKSIVVVGQKAKNAPPLGMTGESPMMDVEAARSSTGNCQSQL